MQPHSLAAVNFRDLYSCTVRDRRQTESIKYGPREYYPRCGEKIHHPWSRACLIYPEADFLERRRRNTIIAQPTKPGSDLSNSRLLLQSIRQGYYLEHALTAIKINRRKSSKSRESTDRAFFAKAAMFYSVTSGYLQLYGGMTLWLRHFLRDPLTAKTVFNISATNTMEGIALLSNIPYDAEQSTAVKIRQRVVQANEVLLENLESAV